MPTNTAMYSNTEGSKLSPARAVQSDPLLFLHSLQRRCDACPVQSSPKPGAPTSRPETHAGVEKALHPRECGPTPIHAPFWETNAASLRSPSGESLQSMQLFRRACLQSISTLRPMSPTYHRQRSVVSPRLIGAFVNPLSPQGECFSNARIVERKQSSVCFRIAS